MAMFTCRAEGGARHVTLPPDRWTPGGSPADPAGAQRGTRRAPWARFWGGPATCHPHRGQQPSVKWGFHLSTGQRSGGVRGEPAPTQRGADQVSTLRAQRGPPGPPLPTSRRPHLPRPCHDGSPPHPGPPPGSAGATVPVLCAQAALHRPSLRTPPARPVRPLGRGSRCEGVSCCCPTTTRDKGAVQRVPRPGGAHDRGASPCSRWCRVPRPGAGGRVRRARSPAGPQPPPASPYPRDNSPGAARCWPSSLTTRTWGTAKRRAREKARPTQPPALRAQRWGPAHTLRGPSPPTVPQSPPVPTGPHRSPPTPSLPRRTARVWQAHSRCPRTRRGTVGATHALVTRVTLRGCSPGPRWGPRGGVCTSTTAAAGPTKAYSSPPSRESQQLGRERAVSGQAWVLPATGWAPSSPGGQERHRDGPEDPAHMTCPPPAGPRRSCFASEPSGAPAARSPPFTDGAGAPRPEQHSGGSGALTGPSPPRPPIYS